QGGFRIQLSSPFDSPLRARNAGRGCFSRALLPVSFNAYLRPVRDDGRAYRIEDANDRSTRIQRDAETAPCITHRMGPLSALRERHLPARENRRTASGRDRRRDL